MKNLRNLTTEKFETQFKAKVQEERRITLEILHYFKEAERRMLFAERSFSSLIGYAVNILKYSETAAKRRVSAMHLLYDVPEIEGKILSGALSLSVLAQLADVLKRHDKIRGRKSTAQEKREVLKHFDGLSIRDADRKLAELFPDAFAQKKEKVRAARDGSYTVETTLDLETHLIVEEIRDLIGEAVPLSELIKMMGAEFLKGLRKKRGGDEFSRARQQPSSISDEEVTREQKPNRRRQKHPRQDQEPGDIPTAGKPKARRSKSESRSMKTVRRADGEGSSRVFESETDEKNQLVWDFDLGAHLVSGDQTDLDDGVRRRTFAGSAEKSPSSHAADTRNPHLGMNAFKERSALPDSDWSAALFEILNSMNGPVRLVNAIESALLPDNVLARTSTSDGNHLIDEQLADRPPKIKKSHSDETFGSQTDFRPTVGKRKRKYLSVHVARSAFARADGRCEYVDPVSGMRCSERRHLEKEHHIPIALGGTNDSENILWLCSTHNRLRALEVFGPETMEMFVPSLR